MKNLARCFMRSFVPKRKAYYRVTIDYNWDAKKEGRHLHVDTHITLETEGSIIVIFSAVFGSILGIYYFIGNYPSFKEGCKILREDAERLLRRMLERRCKSLTVGVHLVSPATSDHPSKESFMPVVTSDYFWPMLVSLVFNIILGILLLMLVWRALRQVYF